MKRLYPDWLDLHLSLAKYYIHRNLPSLALSEVAAGLKIEPGRYEIRVQKAYLLSMLGKHSDAVLECDAAIRSDANKSLGYYTRSLALARLKRFAESGADLFKALEINPEVSHDIFISSKVMSQ